MSPEFLTIGMFATLILFIVLGLPLAYSLAGTAVIYGLIENGFNVDGLLGFYINNAWGTMNNFVLVAVPLFILMAQLLDRAKISDALFEALYVVMGPIKGGLGLAVIFVCVILAATTGIVGASVVGMALLAGPKLLEKGYNKEMSAGLICSGGTLGILIPPSIMLVVYGGLTGLKETSVGALFAAAILPGLLLSFLYMAYVFIMCQVKPTYGPPISKKEASGYSARQKMWMVIKSMVPPLVLIFAVMGTILGGIATPSEAAGVGVMGAAILAIARGSFNWTVVYDSCKATLRTTSMVMILVLFGNLFSATFLFVGGGDVITDLLIGGDLQPAMVLFIMLFAVFHNGHVHRLGGNPFGLPPGFHAGLSGAWLQSPVVLDADLHRFADFIFNPSLRLCAVLFCRRRARRKIPDDGNLQRSAAVHLPAGYWRSVLHPLSVNHHLYSKRHFQLIVSDKWSLSRTTKIAGLYFDCCPGALYLPPSGLEGIGNFHRHRKRVTIRKHLINIPRYS
jgi:tripartite ATP-independent transporter DctM subunit